MPVTLRGNAGNSFRIGTGNVSNPALAFASSNTTGFFLTNGNVGIAVNGTERLKITPDGLVVTGNVVATGSFIGDGSLLTGMNNSTLVSNVQVANATYSAVDDTAVDVNGGFVLINGSGFLGGSMVLVGGTPATSTTILSYTKLGAQVPAKAAGTYAVTVVRPDSISVNLPLGVTYSQSPVWSTSSSLGNAAVYESFTKTLAASSDSNITYSNVTTLPPQTTLASNGSLMGNILDLTSASLYTFTIRATDSEYQDSDRTFSLNVVNPFLTADAVYSLRKINTAYTGNCIQVRRSSDNAVANIGFTNNQLDESSLLAFVGAGNDGFVSIWYDQSGYGRNLSQATAASQPAIVGNGAVIRDGTSPALWFSGSSYLDGGDILDFGVNSWATTTVAKIRNGTIVQEQMLWSKSFSSGTATNGRYYLDIVPYVNPSYSYAYTDDSATGSVVCYHDPRELTVYSAKYNRGIDFRMRVNRGTDVVSAAYPAGVNGNISTPFRIGAYTNTDNSSPILYMYGTVQEHIHYISTLPENYRISVESNTMSTYKPTPITPQVASGGTLTTVSGYTIHTFTSSGNFVMPVSGSVEYLVVAGGGGGGAGATAVTPFLQGSDGQNSVFANFVGFGGGGGGSNFSQTYAPGRKGGCGGGSVNGSSVLEGAGVPGQGFPGGRAGDWSGYYGGGGGGGAGGPGYYGLSTAGGNGGPGMMSSISGAVAYYGGGGGGGTYLGGTVGAGGIGGGGAGGGVNGTANTGGGGGGQKDNSATIAGTGGSGVVILRYKLN